MSISVEGETSFVNNSYGIPVRSLENGSQITLPNGINVLIDLPPESVNRALNFSPSKLYGMDEDLNGLISHTLVNVMNLPSNILQGVDESIVSSYLQSIRPFADSSQLREAVRAMVVDYIHMLNQLECLADFLVNDGETEIRMQRTQSIIWLRDFAEDYFDLADKVVIDQNPNFEVDITVPSDLMEKPYNSLLLLHLFELIKNSWKVGAKNSFIEISEAEAGHLLQTTIVVSDDGPGVPNIRGSFEEGKSTTNSTGYGLDAFRRFAYRIGMPIRIESGFNSVLYYPEFSALESPLDEERQGLSIEMIVQQPIPYQEDYDWFY